MHISNWILAVAGSVALAACASTPAPKKTIPVVSAPANGGSQQSSSAAQPPVLPAGPIYGGSSASRIVQVAMRENYNWYQPFIDANGGLRYQRTTESEKVRLADGTTSWEKVVSYWRNSGTLYSMIDSGIAGATSCQNTVSTSAECRAFLLDNPWSAAFISYVMIQAGLTNFNTSPAHIDYIRDAYNGTGPFLMMNPATTQPAQGDLICYVRNTQAIVGYEGLSAAFSNNPSLRQAAHCDVVTKVDRNARLLESVGGNVLNGVTLRKLRMDDRGIAILPRPTSFATSMDEEDAGAGSCSPMNESACSMNRQNWAAVLRLRQP